MNPCSLNTCRNSAKHICSQCLQSAYCSRECQKVDWVNGHEQICWSLIEGGGTKRGRAEEEEEERFLELAKEISSYKGPDVTYLDYVRQQLVEMVTLENLPRMRSALGGSDYDYLIMEKALFTHNVRLLKTFLQMPNVSVKGSVFLDSIKFQVPPVMVQMLAFHPTTNVNFQNEEGGKTPLMKACSRYSTEIVEILLSHPKIEVNTQNKKNGYTALHYASEGDESGHVRALLSHPDTNPNLRAEKKWTPLMIAAQNSNDPEMFRLFLSHPNIYANLQDVDGYTALVHFITTNQTEYKTETIEAFVNSRKVNVNIGDNYGVTPLMYAAASPVERMVYTSVLLSHPRINVNLQDTDGVTALMHAYTNEAKRLIAMHPDTDFFIKDNGGRLAMDYCQNRGCKLLLFSLMRLNIVPPGTPADVSKKLALTRLRDHLCASLSEEATSRENLLALAEFISLPVKNRATKAELCVDISTVLAVGNTYEKEKFEEQKRKSADRLASARNTLFSVIDSFRWGLSEFSGVNTEGMTPDQLLELSHTFI